jgi:hypothetical protein
LVFLIFVDRFLNILNFDLSVLNNFWFWNFQILNFWNFKYFSSLNTFWI